MAVELTPREDNMLKITSDGRKAALDLRLLTSQIPDSALPLTKSQAAAEVIAHIWKETEKYRSAQLVFCDLGTPSMDGLQNETALPEGVEFEPSPVTDEEKAAFENVYADLKAKTDRSGGETGRDRLHSRCQLAGKAYGFVRGRQPRPGKSARWLHRENGHRHDVQES